MWIVCQDKRSVINADNTIGIAVSDNFVIAKTIDNAKHIVLGAYKSDERANDVFLGVLDEMFPLIQDAEIVTENISRKSWLYVKTDKPEAKINSIVSRVYYMPEE